MEFNKYTSKELVQLKETMYKVVADNYTQAAYDIYAAIKAELKKRAEEAAKNIKFHRVDNGVDAKSDYHCDNGLVIVADNYPELNGVYKYFVGDKGFECLKDAKEYCLMFGAIAE